MAEFKRPRLGVNVDHVATLRQARGTIYPDPVSAAAVAELAGADQITVHLREDRRHIQDRDVDLLRQTVTTKLNLEMGATQEMAAIALRVRPDMITLVPEKREERTTEGGLDIVGNQQALKAYIEGLRASGAMISLFIDPNAQQVQASLDVGADIIELHTGDYCETAAGFDSSRSHAEHVELELEKLVDMTALGASLGLIVAAGHGLDYKNVLAVAGIAQIEEFNIGHSIIARSVFVGLDQAVREMITALELGRTYGS